MSAVALALSWTIPFIGTNGGLGPANILGTVWVGGLIISLARSDLIGRSTETQPIKRASLDSGAVSGIRFISLGIVPRNPQPKKPALSRISRRSEVGYETG